MGGYIIGPTLVLMQADWVCKQYFMIIDTCEIIMNNHTCEIIDFISGEKNHYTTLFYIINSINLDSVANVLRACMHGFFPMKN